MTPRARESKTWLAQSKFSPLIFSTPTAPNPVRWMFSARLPAFVACLAGQATVLLSNVRESERRSMLGTFESNHLPPVAARFASA
jgi:hypothetical protein